MRKEQDGSSRKYDSDILRARQGLRAWFGRPLGQWLIEVERAELDKVLPGLFGYYLVQVGSSMDDNLLESSRIRMHIVINDIWPGGRADYRPAPVLGMYGHCAILPVQSDTVDVVVLPHTLEFEADPHEALREVERVLVPEGHVVILGFNPWSLWGVWRMFRWRRKSYPPWHGSFRGIIRIKDWLALLGFDIVVARSFFFRPPLQRVGMMRRLLWLERLGCRWWRYLGGAYIIVAKKRVVTLTPIRPRWRPRRSLIQPDVAKPTT